MNKTKLSPRKRPSQERSRATVEALLGATAYILVRDGYASLTTNRVAERAGVNIASLYQFFPGKDALVAELQRRHVEETRAAMKKVFERHRATGSRRAEGDAMLRTMLEAGVAAHLVQPELHRVFADELPRLRLTRPTVASEQVFLEEMHTFYASRKRAPKNLELSLWVVSTTVHAAIHQCVLERPHDARSGALVDELVRLLEPYLELT